MVNTKKNIVHSSDSKIECESWVDTMGKSEYPGSAFKVKREPNGKFNVYKTK